MPSVPPSPSTSSFKRSSVGTSNLEIPPGVEPNVYTSGANNATSISRRSSRTSQTLYTQQSPVTPRPASGWSSRRTSMNNRRKSSSRLSIGSNISLGAADGGMGNLADELEDALEDEYDVHSGSFMDGAEDSKSPHMTENGVSSPLDTIEQTPPKSRNSLLPESPTKWRSPDKEKRKSRHQRTESKYDGSDYGPESDNDEEGLPPMLAKRMGDIEFLSRTSVNADDVLSEDGGVVKRTTHALKDLGPQATLENHLSRIITAYTSMATHRAHKTRDLFSQAHSLLYGNILELSEDTIDVLLFELERLASTIPVIPQQNPLLSLQILASQTLDLAQSLRSLTDVLQEFRISASTATRKLKSVRDMVEELRMEEDLMEDSMMLIQAGDWDRRCRDRQAAAMCREVIKGFGDRWDLEPENRSWMQKAELKVS